MAAEDAPAKASAGFVGFFARANLDYSLLRT